MIGRWMNDITKIYTSDAMKLVEISHLYISIFVLVMWPWRLPEEWPEICGSLTVVGAETMALT